tara:strand:- start:420 stop:1685 length:1266 start_codon:yes stop_codon:yes gene_type:complete
VYTDYASVKCHFFTGVFEVLIFTWWEFMTSENKFIDRIEAAADTENTDKIRTKDSKNKFQSIAREVINDSNAAIKNWDITAVKGGVSGGSIFKVYGTFYSDKVFEWSAILKILYKEKATQELTEFDWNREAYLYRSGIVDFIPVCFAAAKCYHVEDVSEEEIWIWIEDLSEDNNHWPLERYALAARHLGQMNGHFYQQKPLYEPWMVKEFERQAISRDLNIDQYHKFSDHPLVKAVIPEKRENIFLDIHDKHTEIITRIFGKIPQSFCHMDAHRGNLFSREVNGENVTIAIDWAFAGINPLGTDLKTLVYHSIGFMYVDVEDAYELDVLSFDSYLQGLKDVGWNGDYLEIRYGYLMVSMMTFIRYACIIPHLLADKERHKFFERITGCPFVEAHEKMIKHWSFLLDLGEEALKLDKELFSY